MVFTATDECGNESSVTRTVTIVDVTPPTIAADGDLNLDCSDPIPAPGAAVSDNCQDATFTVSEEIIPGNCPQEMTIIRTYTADDGCGNTATGVQTITITDTTAPEIQNPPVDVTVQCDEAVPAYAPIWTDDCGTVSETAISSTSIDGCTEIQSIVFTATDECGNESSVTRTVTIVDTTPPTIAVDGDLTLDCSDPIPAPGAAVSDNCQDATFTVSEEIIPRKLSSRNDNY